MGRRKKKIADKNLVPKIQKIGVYAIHNKKNNKYYIGSSVNVYSRLLTQCMVINRTGLNLRILEDISKKDYDFEFLVLETFEDGTITDKELRKKEYFYMKRYDSMKNGYNVNHPWETGRYKEDQKLICPIKEVKEREIKEKNNYVNKYDRFSFVMSEGTKQKIKDAAEKQNKSINQFIADAVLQAINTEFPSEKNLPFD